MNKCVVCGFSMRRKDYRKNVLYCSEGCKKQREGINPNSTGKVGGAYELLVCADLVLNGWEVFRAVTQSASCDLIRLKDGFTERVEVRAGQFSSAGTLSYPRAYSTKCDVVAVVTPERQIIYCEPAP